MLSFFFEIFSEEIFFKNVEFVEIQNTINVFKKVILDEKTYSIKIIYENNPIKIRKIYIDGDDAGFEIGFYEFSKGEFYNKDFYSLVNPYLKN